MDKTEKPRNTEIAGGTRYSEGKPNRAWMPQSGLLDTKLAFDDVINVGYSHPEEALRLLQRVWRVLTRTRYEHHVYGSLVTAAAHAFADIGGFYEGVDEVARVSNYGAEKYAPLDYLEGQSLSTLYSSSHRHATMRLTGVERDEESGHLHMGCFSWNVLCILEFIERGRLVEIDDISPWVGVTAAEAKEDGPRFIRHPDFVV